MSNEKHRHEIDGFAGNPTVRVYDPEVPGGMIIDAKDFNPDEHDVYDPELHDPSFAKSPKDEEEE